MWRLRNSSVCILGWDTVLPSYQSWQNHQPKSWICNTESSDTMWYLPKRTPRHFRQTHGTHGLTLAIFVECFPNNAGENESESSFWGTSKSSWQMSPMFSSFCRGYGETAYQKWLSKLSKSITCLIIFQQHLTSSSWKSCPLWCPRLLGSIDAGLHPGSW